MIGYLQLPFLLFMSTTIFSDNLMPMSNSIAHPQIVKHNDIANESQHLKNITHFSKWTAWSRCENCLQRRVKRCIHRHCKHSRIYEERPCQKKRCRRKRRSKNFHIVHLEETDYDTKAYSTIWNKWSKWSPCDDNCRTFRMRKCRRVGQCKKNKQTQSAYCYHEHSECEDIVMGSHHRVDAHYDTYDSRYEYHRKHEGRSTNSLPYTPVAHCGRRYRKSRMLRIIGGAESKKYKWPWHVAVINQFNEVFCAGTLIAPQWVLTAAHCIRHYLRVRFNEHDLNSDDGKELEMTVHRKYIHPGFNENTVENDIALLRLPRSVRLPPACLPTQKPATKDLCTIMGWGKTNSRHEFGTSRLHEAKIPIVSWQNCTKAYRRYFLSENMLCAGWASGVADTCAGDSGGGLICPPKKWAAVRGFSVQGITSFGDGCGRKNKYGIYTMVYNYLDWIHYIIDPATIL